MFGRFPSGVPIPSLITRPRPIERCQTAIRYTRDVSRVQLLWHDLLQRVRDTCCDDFWKFFLPMHHLSRTAIDTALLAAKSTFTHDFHKFPLTTRTLFRKIQAQVSGTSRVHVSLRTCACVLTSGFVCPDDHMHVSSRAYFCPHVEVACVLMQYYMCPYG